MTTDQENPARKVALDRLIGVNSFAAEEPVGMTREYDPEWAQKGHALTFGDLRELEKLIAEQAAELEALSLLEDCGQEGVCANPPGCNRHWQERNRELVQSLNVREARYVAAQEQRNELQVVLNAVTELARDLKPASLGGMSYELVERCRKEFLAVLGVIDD